MGGLIIILSTVTTTLLWAKLNNPFVQKAIVLVIWFGALGGVDDWLKLTLDVRHRSRNGLRPWEKLIFQIGGAVLIASFLYADFVNIDDAKLFWLPFYKHGLPLANWMFILVAIFISRPPAMPSTWPMVWTDWPPAASEWSLWCLQFSAMSLLKLCHEPPRLPGQVIFCCLPYHRPANSPSFILQS